MNKENNIIIGNSDYDQVSFDSEQIVNGEIQCLTVGNSGSGKSYLTRNIIEELYAKKLGNILVIDPEGEYFSLRKLFDFVILGLNEEKCDIIITKENAANLAVQMLKNKINVIIDVSYTDDDNRQEIVSNYIDAIIDNSSPMIFGPVTLQIIIEETSRFAKRRINTISNTKCIASFKKLLQLGRMRRISTFYNAQRANQIPIAIRSEHNNMIIGRCSDDADIKRNASIIGLKNSSEIKSLKNYEFITWGDGFINGNYVNIGFTVENIKLVNVNKGVRVKSLTPKSEHGMKSLLELQFKNLPKSETVIKWIELMGG